MFLSKLFRKKSKEPVIQKPLIVAPTDPPTFEVAKKQEADRQRVVYTKSPK